MMLNVQPLSSTRQCLEDTGGSALQSVRVCITDTFFVASWAAGHKLSCCTGLIYWTLDILQSLPVPEARPPAKQATLLAMPIDPCCSSRRPCIRQLCSRK